MKNFRPCKTNEATYAAQTAMSSGSKSVGKRISFGAIFVGAFLLVFGVGHYFGRLAERKDNAVYNVKVLTDTYELLESNDLERVKSRLRFMIFENVMTYDREFGSPVATNSVSIRLWSHAREITREEETNVVPFSEQIILDRVNNFIKTNNVVNTNAVKNP